MTRVIKPNVINVFDNAVVQVKCDPAEDPIDVHAILQQSLSRFEFVLGTSFDLQFLNLAGTTILAMQRYIVSEVVERVVVADVNHYQTMTKTVFDRKCQPLTKLIVFDPVAEVLREKPARPRLSDVNIDEMNANELQKVMKSLSGKGFPPGTSRDDMVKKLREDLRVS